MIKKISIIGLMLLLLLLPSTGVFAAEPQITIEGESEASPRATKIITLKVSSDELEVGVVSGKIDRSTNIESVEVIGKNNWNLTYNSENGVFNVYKAEGAKREEILNIQYTLKNEEGIANITISDLELTTIDYESTNIEEIVKEIKIIERNDSEGCNSEVGKSEDDTKVDKELAQTGLEEHTFAIITVVAIIAYISYKKYQQYKNIM